MKKNIIVIALTVVLSVSLTIIISNALTQNNENDRLKEMCIRDRSGDYPLTPLEASAKIRYSQDEVKCLIHPVGKDEIKIEFEQPVRAAAAGQSVVFYSGEELLGGAIIK